MRYDLLSLVGNTPLVEIRRLNPHANVKILAKLESKNPGGSIKDRVALAMIERAEANGELTPEKTVIEATSGNTGIGLAMVCAVKGYRLLLLMADNVSEERKRILRAYGAEIMHTPGRLGTDGAIEKAYRMARENPDAYVLVDQYNNPASIEAHRKGTAAEIWRDTEGTVTHAVASLGTSGTAMGLVKGLKEFDPKIQVAAVEPSAGHKIQGLKNMHESYPPGIFDRKALDAILRVGDEEAFENCRLLAREEGLLVGMSSGAALAGALRLAEGLESGVVVVIFPDSGERYLSTPLFVQPEQHGLGLVNIASMKKVHVEASGGRAGLFTMGPSLDDLQDLDAWRRIVLLDVLARRLESRGMDATIGVGLADLDDRALEAARAAGMGRAAFAEQAAAELERLAVLLRIAPRARFTLAGNCVDTALGLCRKLLAKGLGYEKLRSVYFDVLREDHYGELARVDVEKLSVGKTVDMEAYVKEHDRDFTLLKRASLQDLKLGDVLETEWGNVRPSWFLQMAAAGLDGLGAVDVLLAGETHQFPHLENLRAIWAADGVAPLVWMISKSVGRPSKDHLGLEQAAELAGGPCALRLWLLSAAYRKPLAATEENLAMWSRNWRKLQELVAGLRSETDWPAQEDPAVAGAEAEALERALAKALEDDLSLHRFWPELFLFIKTVNSLASEGRLGAEGAKLCLESIARVDAILGVVDETQLPAPTDSLSPEAARLVQEREQARKSKDFARADALRAALAEEGYRVEDTPSGARIFPV